MAKQQQRRPKAIIYHSTARGKDGKRIKGFRFRLKGKNGEPLAPSEHYTRKASALKVLARYFANFEVVDKTVNIVSNIVG